MLSLAGQGFAASRMEFSQSIKVGATMQRGVNGAMGQVVVEFTVELVRFPIES